MIQLSFIQNKSYVNSMVIILDIINSISNSLSFIMFKDFRYCKLFEVLLIHNYFVKNFITFVEDYENDN